MVFGPYRHVAMGAKCYLNPSVARAQILVAQKVTAGVYKGVTTSELDELAAETAAALTSTHPDYATVSFKLLSPFSSDSYASDP